MRTCPPAEFVSRWPGSLLPITFPDPPPALPQDCRRLLAEFGLPHELAIDCYNHTTLTFSGTATPLAAIWEWDIRRGYALGGMPNGWTRFWHLADQEYLQGGGWVCVEEITGRLVVIDLDLPEPVYLLSPSVRDLYTTLAYFLAWTEQTGGAAAEVIRLRDALRHQDRIPPAELEPFWLNLVDATLDGDPTRVAVTVGRRTDPGAAPAAGGR